MKSIHWYIIVIGALVLWLVLDQTKANGARGPQSTNPDDPRNLLDWTKPFPWLKDIPSPADIITNLESLIASNSKDQSYLERIANRLDPAKADAGDP